MKNRFQGRAIPNAECKFSRRSCDIELSKTDSFYQPYYIYPHFDEREINA